MLLGRDPNMTIAPFAQIAQLLHFGMIVLDIILDGQTTWVEDTDIAP